MSMLDHKLIYAQTRDVAFNINYFYIHKSTSARLNEVNGSYCNCLEYGEEEF